MMTQEPPPPGPPVPLPYPPPYYQPQTNGLGVAAMVLGIVGLLLAWIPFIGFLGMLCGVLALILGIVGIGVGRRNRSGVGMAIAGTVLGGLTIVSAILWLVALSPPNELGHKVS